MRLALGLVMVVGCAGDASTFELTVYGAPKFVAERIDDGAWTDLTAAIDADMSTFVAQRGDLIELMVACEHSTGVGIASLRTTRDELDRSLANWQLSCRDAIDRTVTLSGRATARASPTFIFVGGLITIADQPSDGGGYTLKVAPATEDLVITNHERMRIVRDADLHADVVEPDVDLEEETALASGTVDFDPVDPDENATGIFSFVTRGGTVPFWTTQTGKTPVIPAALLVDGDDQYVGIDAIDHAGGDRSFSGRVGPEFPDRVTLLPRLGDVAFDPASLTATWSPFAADYRELSLVCRGDAFYAGVNTSRGWARAHVESTVQLAIDAPDWDPAWIVPAADGNCRFGVSANPRGGQTYFSGHSF